MLKSGEAKPRGGGAADAKDERGGGNGEDETTSGGGTGNERSTHPGTGVGGLFNSIQNFVAAQQHYGQQQQASGAGTEATSKSSSVPMGGEQPATGDTEGEAAGAGDSSSGRGLASLKGMKSGIVGGAGRRSSRGTGALQRSASSPVKSFASEDDGDENGGSTDGAVGEAKKGRQVGSREGEAAKEEDGTQSVTEGRSEASSVESGSSGIPPPGVSVQPAGPLVEISASSGSETPDIAGGDTPSKSSGGGASATPTRGGVGDVSRTQTGRDKAEGTVNSSMRPAAGPSNDRVPPKPTTRKKKKKPQEEDPEVARALAAALAVSKLKPTEQQRLTHTGATTDAKQKALLENFVKEQHEKEKQQQQLQQQQQGPGAGLKLEEMRKELGGQVSKWQQEVRKHQEKFKESGFKLPIPVPGQRERQESMSKEFGPTGGAASDVEGKGKAADDTAKEIGKTPMKEKSQRSDSVGNSDDGENETCVGGREQQAGGPPSTTTTDEKEKESATRENASDPTKTEAEERTGSSSVQGEKATKTTKNEKPPASPQTSQRERIKQQGSSFFGLPFNKVSGGGGNTSSSEAEKGKEDGEDKKKNHLSNSSLSQPPVEQTTKNKGLGASSVADEETSKNAPLSGPPPSAPPAAERERMLPGATLKSLSASVSASAPVSPGISPLAGATKPSILGSGVGLGQLLSSIKGAPLAQASSSAAAQPAHSTAPAAVVPPQKAGRRRRSSSAAGDESCAEKEESRGAPRTVPPLPASSSSSSRSVPAAGAAAASSSAPSKDPPTMPAQRLDTTKGSKSTAPAEAPENNPPPPSATSSFIEEESDMSQIVWKRRDGLGKLSSNAWQRRRLEIRDTKLVYFQEEHVKIREATSNVSEASAGTDATSPNRPKLLQSFSQKPNGGGGNWWEQAAAAVQANLTANFAQGAEPVGGGVAGGDRSHTFAPDGTALSDPRGSLDLVKDSVVVTASSASDKLIGSGGPPPTPFSITVKSMRAGGETWKFCFDTHKDQMDWLTAMANVTVRSAMEEFLEERATSGGGAQLHCVLDGPYYSICEGPIAPEGAGEEKVIAEGRSGEDPSSANVQDEDTTNDDGEVVPTQVVPTAVRVKLAREDFWKLVEGNRHLTGKKLEAVLVLANLALVLVRNGRSFWLWFFLFNFSVWFCLDTEDTDSSAKAKKGKKRKPKAKAKKASSKVALGTDAQPSATELGRTSDLGPPVAGSSTVKAEEDKPLEPSKVGKVQWRATPPSQLNVRSVGYSKSKQKIPSPGCLYELTAVDVLVSDTRIGGMSQKVDMSKLLAPSNGKEPKWKSPDVFVITVSIPVEAPKMGFAAAEDGEGFTISGYFTMKEDTRKVLEKISEPGFDSTADGNWPEGFDVEKVNAVRLFEEWCRLSPEDPKFQGRFKFIPSAVNPEEIGLPSYMSKYNGKPVLIKRAGVTGILNSYDHSVMEFEINLHVFPYFAKQAFNYMYENLFKVVIVNMGFVIEGRCDEELPEVVIGGVQLCYPDPEFAVTSDAFFT